MAQYLIGNFLDDPDATEIVVPTCGVFKRNGELVMGAGAAKAAKLRFPGIQHCEAFTRTPGRIHRYGAFILQERGKRAIWALQTKMDYRDDADLELIDYSLATIAPWMRDMPIVSMAYPGIGKGKLSKEDVQPLIEKHLGFLGDRLRVYDLEEK